MISSRFCNKRYICELSLQSKRSSSLLSVGWSVCYAPSCPPYSCSILCPSLIRMSSRLQTNWFWYWLTHFLFPPPQPLLICPIHSYFSSVCLSHSRPASFISRALSLPPSSMLLFHLSPCLFWLLVLSRSLSVSPIFPVSFLQALSAADLNLVLYVCETIDSQQVFGQQPCPLIQPVLLSLIQQLSTNLGTRTELKIR